MALVREAQRISFWSLSAPDVAEELETDIPSGLSEDEASRRLETFGPNVIEQTKGAHGLFILLSQFKSPLIIVLTLAGVITYLIGHERDSLFIFAAVVVNAALGFYQEYKAERALSGLKTYLRERARVIRKGEEREIEAAELVPGDVIRLSQGDRVPADARLVFADDLQIDEAVLTGESLPVTKSIDPSPDTAVLGDQLGMVFAGTLVTEGVATAIVCRTASGTELGKIATLVGTTGQEDTPLQKAIKRFSSEASVFLGLLTLLVFVVGITMGHSVADMFITSVAIAVSAVPEGLPVAMTVILAIGVQRMAERKGVIRKLVAAEALGSTTYILTDKTGTLTMAKMQLSQLHPVSGIEENALLKLALINSNVLVENKDDPPQEWRMNGKILETSLVRSAALRGILADDVKSKVTIVDTLPFSAINKFSVSLIHENGKHRLVLVGAAEVLAMHSTLSPESKKELAARIDTLAGTGEFVIGVAVKEVGPGEERVFDNKKNFKLADLSFKGLITLRDPVRPGVAEAIRRVERAGIKVMIMTGDHRGTAEAIAKAVGMGVEPGSVLDATELRALSDEQLKARVPALRVVSRVSPLDKLRIAKVLQEMGEVVAMTGDGVNDAPSIKQADIGIAMGSGTEVARGVADLVLLDDNFETIVAAVEEGRRIMKNIRKVLVYLLSSVSDELLLIGGALVTGLPLPLSALQILYVNFFSDSFPAIAFAFERDVDGLSGKPRARGSSLFDPLMRFLILFIGFSTTAFLFALYWIMLRIGVDVAIAQTFIFASFGSYTLFLAFSLRSLEKSIFEYGFFSNRYLVGGVGIGMALMFSAIYLPVLQGVLGTVALPLPWLLAVVAVGLLNISATEVGKYIFRRREAIR